MEDQAEEALGGLVEVAQSCSSDLEVEAAYSAACDSFPGLKDKRKKACKS